MFMEKRTLVKCGASSFNVAVPIDWVRKHRLEKGSEVSIEENERGELVLSTGCETTVFQQNHHTIKVDSKDNQLLYWELLSAYLKNYTSINLEGENVSISAGPALQKLDSFIGLDIIERTKKIVVLKNFSARDTETSPYGLVKKLDIGVRAMIEMIETFFSKGFSPGSVLELQSQHEYNDRVYLFALKVINNIIDNPSLMRVFKTDYRQLMREYELIRSLRQISSNLAKMGNLLLFVEHKSKGGHLFNEMFSDIYEKYLAVLTFPKNSLSKDVLKLLNDSRDKASSWESSMKYIKVQPLIELFIHGIEINNTLDQLALELMS